MSCSDNTLHLTHLTFQNHSAFDLTVELQKSGWQKESDAVPPTRVAAGSELSLDYHWVPGEAVNGFPDGGNPYVRFLCTTRFGSTQAASCELSFGIHEQGTSHRIELFQTLLDTVYGADRLDREILSHLADPQEQAAILGLFSFDAGNNRHGLKGVAREPRSPDFATADAAHRAVAEPIFQAHGITTRYLVVFVDEDFRTWSLLE